MGLGATIAVSSSIPAMCIIGVLYMVVKVDLVCNIEGAIRLGVPPPSVE